jgi:peptide/nickel transport system substrate-binding protein
MNVVKSLCLVFSVAFLLGSCKTEPTSITEDTVVKVALHQSPSRLSPMLSSTAIAREVYTYLFLPLADYDPETLELSPILAKSVPQGETIGEGAYKGMTGYTFELRDEARWDNGSEITAKDYIFTLKSTMHPKVEAPIWRSYFSSTVDIIEYDDNPKKFTVVSDDNYFLVKEAACTFEIYPEYIYDSLGVLRSTSVSDFLDEEKINVLVENDSLLQNYASKFNSAKYSREVIVGAGPYKFIEWVDDQYVHLEKKEDWWGEKTNVNSFLFKAYPKTLQFQFIADATTALTALKDGSIDVLPRISATDFFDLKDSELSGNFNFLTPDLFRYYYLAINNQNPKLAERNVRRALAHCLDVELIINNLDKGYGNRVIGHFNPVRSYYNKDITPVEFNLEKARSLLSEGGWEDSNNNGILDKNLNGELVELNITYTAGRGNLGKQVGLILKENAKKIGIEINMISKDFRVIRQDLTNHDYEMTPMVISQDVNRDDPYSKWHTDNTLKGKGNWFGYGDVQSDALIDSIRYTNNEDIRRKAYLDLQEKMHEDTPVIFLYSPKGKIVVNKKFNSVASAKRPGYFINTFKLAKEAVVLEN